MSEKNRANNEHGKKKLKIFLCVFFSSFSFRFSRKQKYVLLRGFLSGSLFYFELIAYMMSVRVFVCLLQHGCLPVPLYAIDRWLFFFCICVGQMVCDQDCKLLDVFNEIFIWTFCVVLPRLNKTVNKLFGELNVSVGCFCSVANARL